ncbi:hypothetical protein [Haloferax profundi]|uniref:Uncharacterized protein n=1 Tax=Haloferax profundi TaxID=1544718 RepID=A0A0W1SLG9_9EURY|nr:hypothetical protein [Haloferax profundi]KTG27036.1 hypothetical protein AUR66_15025 [Haloferax profundi]
MHEFQPVSLTVVGESGDTGGGVFEFEASVVLLRGDTLNLWVGDEHFVADSEGGIQRGQYVLVTTPTTGSIARIVETSAPASPDPRRPIEVELEYRWNAETFVTEPTVEFWTRDELAVTGPHESHTGGDERVVTFVRPTST